MTTRFPTLQSQFVISKTNHRLLCKQGSAISMLGSPETMTDALPSPVLLMRDTLRFSSPSAVQTPPRPLRSSSHGAVAPAVFARLARTSSGTAIQQRSVSHTATKPPAARRSVSHQGILPTGPRRTKPSSRKSTGSSAMIGTTTTGARAASDRLAQYIHGTAASGSRIWRVLRVSSGPCWIVDRKRNSSGEC